MQTYNNLVNLKIPSWGCFVRRTFQNIVLNKSILALLETYWNLFELLFSIVC